MVEYNPEIHENKVQCDICEEWFEHDETVMVDAKFYIMNCIPCKDNDDDEMRYLHLQGEDEIRELYDEEILEEE